MKSGYAFIGDNVFPTLLALSEEEQSQGLMYLDPPTPIMSFVFAAPKINGFWMRNCQAPLDIVFCHQGKVSEIAYGEPHSTRIIGGHFFSDLVVELPAGSVQSSQIILGQSAGLISPSIQELREAMSKNNGQFLRLNCRP